MRKDRLIELQMLFYHYVQQQGLSIASLLRCILQIKKEIRHVSGSLTVLLSPNYKAGSTHSTAKFIVDGLICPHFDISLA